MTRLFDLLASVATPLGAVIAITGLLAVHELGHLLGARAVGIGVPVFSIFSGPPIFRRQVGSVEVRLGSIPFFAYVQLLGLHQRAPETLAQVERMREEGRISAKTLERYSNPKSWYSTKSGWAQLVAILAGPIASIALAFPLMFVAVSFHGDIVAPFVVEEVRASSPAERAGLLPGDVVTALQGASVKRMEELAEVVSSASRERAPLSIRVSREGAPVELTARFENERETLGVKFIERPVPFGERFGRASEYLWKIEGGIVTALGKLVQHPGQSAGEMVGPVGIVTTTVTAAKGGADSFFFMMAALTVNLGIMNLLPLPALDGGQALFAAYKAVTGREAPLVARRVLITGSFLLLFGLLIELTVKDLVGLVGGMIG